MSAIGEWAVFDGSDHCGLASPPNYNSFLSIDYTNGLTVKDMEIQNYFQCGYVNSGVFGYSLSINCRFENLHIHDFSTPRGFSGGGGLWWTHFDDPNFNVQEPFWGREYTDSTFFINVVMHDLCDTLGGGNAGDGYKLAFYGNNYVEWRNCRTYSYSDDGWDVNSIDGAELVFYNCYAMSTQKYERFDIEGNGYKWTTMYRNNSMHSDDFHFIKVFESVAAGNNYMGFYPNLYSYGSRDDINGLFYKNISYKNEYGTSLRNTSGVNQETYKNNVFFENNIRALDSYSTTGGGNNFAVSDMSDSITVSSWDFLSVDLGEIAKPFAQAGLPDMNLFKLRGSSNLIDQGVSPHVFDGAQYVADSSGLVPSTPDVGIYEFLPYTGLTDLDILSLTFDEQGAYSTYNYTTHTATGYIYYSHRGQVSSLIPTILPSDGDTISPGFETTIDFTNAVTYTVSEIDNPLRTQEWTVSIDTLEPSSFADIREIYINNNIITGINISDTIVSCFFEEGEDVSNLTPNITIDRGAYISPASGAPQDFTSGYIDYTVTAEDEITQKIWRVTMEEMIPRVGTDDTIGFVNVFPETETTVRIRYSPYFITTGGTIESVSIYHNGGSGLMQMAIYDNRSDEYHPNSRVAITSEEPVNASKGWQSINLTTNYTVSPNDTIWIAYVFQNNPGYRTLNNQTLNPNQGYNDLYGYAWWYGLRETAPDAGGWHFISSVYASYSEASVPDPPPATSRGKGSSAGGGKMYIRNGKIYVR